MLDDANSFSLVSFFCPSFSICSFHYCCIIPIVSLQTTSFAVNEAVVIGIVISIVSWQLFGIGGLQSISRDADNNDVMPNCWWTNKRSQ